MRATIACMKQLEYALQLLHKYLKNVGKLLFFFLTKGTCKFQIVSMFSFRETDLSVSAKILQLYIFGKTICLSVFSKIQRLYTEKIFKAFSFFSVYFFELMFFSFSLFLLNLLLSVFLISKVFVIQCFGYLHFHFFLFTNLFSSFFCIIQLILKFIYFTDLCASLLFYFYKVFINLYCLFIFSMIL